MTTQQRCAMTVSEVRCRARELSVAMPSQPFAAKGTATVGRDGMQVRAATRPCYMQREQVILPLRRCFLRMVRTLLVYPLTARGGSFISAACRRRAPVPLRCECEQPHQVRRSVCSASCCLRRPCANGAAAVRLYGSPLLRTHVAYRGAAAAG